MQFGIFSVGDVTADPTTGRTPTEAERIRATVAIAKKAEEVGLTVQRSSCLPPSTDAILESAAKV